MDTEVLIVGAGPSGLMCAALLAEAKVQFRIIEVDPQPIEHSRASLIHVRTLELWDKLGLADVAISRGEKIHALKIRQNGRILVESPFANENLEATPFPFALGLPQKEIQLMLLAEIKKHGYDVEWAKRFEALTQEADSVTASIRTEAGYVESIRARYLVGADGAKSAVRKSLEIALVGETYDQTLFGADVILPDSCAKNAMVFTDVKNGSVAIQPLGPNDFYRIFGTMSSKIASKVDGTSGKDSVTLEEISEWFLNAYPDRKPPTKLLAISAYKSHSRIAQKVQVGRSFLIGDAAHIHSPAGGQGLNLGVGDGFNLGWKLAHVIKGIAPAKLLETYALERLPIAKKIVAGTDRAFKLDASTNPFWRFVNDRVLPPSIALSMKFKPIRNAIATLISQAWIAYRTSPIVVDCIERSSPKAGDLAIGISGRLKKPAYSLVLVEGARERHQLAKYTQQLENIVRATPGIANLMVMKHEESVICRYYDRKMCTVYLVRPDGHIAFRGHMEQHYSDLVEYLQSNFLQSKNAFFALEDNKKDMKNQTRLNHVSLRAKEPQKAAETLGALTGGTVMAFPVKEGAYACFYRIDECDGEGVEFFPIDSQIVKKGKSAAIISGSDYHLDRATHVNLTVPLTRSELESRAKELGVECYWREEQRFLDVWLDDSLLFEIVCENDR